MTRRRPTQKDRLMAMRGDLNAAQQDYMRKIGKKLPRIIEDALNQCIAEEAGSRSTHEIEQAQAAASVFIPFFVDAMTPVFESETDLPGTRDALKERFIESLEALQNRFAPVSNDTTQQQEYKALSVALYRRVCDHVRVLINMVPLNEPSQGWVH